LIVIAKNNQKFYTGKGIDHLNTAAVIYTMLPWLPLLLCSVKYEQGEMGEHQQTKEWSIKFVVRTKWF
jgi:hypothetical protein